MNKLSKKFTAKRAHDIIPPEEVVLGEWFAITLNPDDQGQFFGEPERLRVCVNNFKKVIWPKSNDIYCELYPELSSKGRFHWHGFLQFETPAQVVHFYTNMIHYICLHCTVSIKHFFEAGKPKSPYYHNIAPNVLEQVQLKAVIRGKTLSKNEMFHLNQSCYIEWYEYCTKNEIIQAAIEQLCTGSVPFVTNVNVSPNYDQFLSYVSATRQFNPSGSNGTFLVANRPKPGRNTMPPDHVGITNGLDLKDLGKSTLRPPKEFLDGQVEESDSDDFDSFQTHCHEYKNGLVKPCCKKGRANCSGEWSD